MIPKAELLARLYALIVQVQSAPALCGSTLVADLVAVEAALAIYAEELAVQRDNLTAEGVWRTIQARQAQRLIASQPPAFYQSSITGRWGHGIQHWRKRRAS